MAIQIVNAFNCDGSGDLLGTLLLNNEDVNVVALEILIRDYKKDNPEYNWTDFLGYLDSKAIPYMVIHTDSVDF